MTSQPSTVDARPAGTAAVSRAVSLSLTDLEDEAVHIVREIGAAFERPALLFSGGKDSVVLTRLAEKAFWPGRIPFPLVHVDTGHNFAEVLAFRDSRAAQLGADLVVASVPTAIAVGLVADQPGRSRNALQSAVLLDAVATHRFDALLGGARRDEEKARAKERVVSVRDEFGRWDPRRQRPELWDVYNGRIRPGEHVRAFPLSNWTELDVWHYIDQERLAVPDLYFAHHRDVMSRDGMLVAVTEHTRPGDGEPVVRARVRYRTVGDATCTAAVPSAAATVAEVIRETAASTTTERGATRLDDHGTETAMEDRKREGYF